MFIVHMQIAIKAADISNPARTFTLSKTWSEFIMDEFFKQGMYLIMLYNVV